jgi:hypothetical protein
LEDSGFSAQVLVGVGLLHPINEIENDESFVLVRDIPAGKALNFGLKIGDLGFIFVTDLQIFFPRD